MATTEQEKKEIQKAVEIGIKANTTNRTVKELIRTERSDWYERHRGAVIENSEQIFHPMVDRIYVRDYDKMCEYLHFIPVFGRILLVKEADVAKIETHVKNSIVKHTGAIDKLIKEANIVFGQSGVDAPLEFKNGRKYDVKITSPLGRLYLELLLRADKFLMLMNDLWIRGLLHDGDYDLNEQKRGQFEMDIKRMLNTVNGTVVRQHRAVLNRLRRQNEEAKASKAPVAKSAPVAAAPVAAVVADAEPAAVSKEKPAKVAKAKSAPIEQAAATA